MRPSPIITRTNQIYSVKKKKWKSYNSSGFQFRFCNKTNNRELPIKPSRVQIAAYQLTRTAVCSLDSWCFSEFFVLAKGLKPRDGSDYQLKSHWLASLASLWFCLRTFWPLWQAYFTYARSLSHRCSRSVWTTSTRQISLAMTEKDAQGGSKASVHPGLVTPEASSQKKAKFGAVTLAVNATLDMCSWHGASG